ncbi:MAG: response regulator [Paracoccaceae bacterium]
MRVLIVEGNPDLGWVWRRHLERRGCQVTLAHTQTEAIEVIRTDDVDIIVLNLILDDGSAFAVADFASYRCPKTKIIFTTNSNFFSDGSIFQHIPNACAMMPSEVAPDDLSALVEHYGTAH